MQLKTLQKERMNELKRERERKKERNSCLMFLFCCYDNQLYQCYQWTQPYMFLSSASPHSKSSFLLCSLIPTSVCKLKPMCCLTVVSATANLVFRWINIDIFKEKKAKQTRSNCPPQTFPANSCLFSVRIFYVSLGEIHWLKSAFSHSLAPTHGNMWSDLWPDQIPQQLLVLGQSSPRWPQTELWAVTHGLTGGDAATDINPWLEDYCL